MKHHYDVMGWVEETQTPLCEPRVEAADIMAAGDLALARMQRRSGGWPVRITCIVEVVEPRSRGPISLAIQLERSVAA